MSVPNGDAPILPPRPNPGPEPWPDTGISPAWWGLIAVPILVLAVWRFGRKRRRSPVNPIDKPPPIDADAVSVADQIARLADRVRDGLASRFGIAWAAMTTEELASALAVIEADKAFPRLEATALFEAADRAKFSSSAPDETHLTEAAAWAEAVSAALVAGERSSQNGR